MTVAQELATLRSELTQLRQEIRAMQNHLHELETVKEADQDYKLRLADLDSKLERIKKRNDEQKREKDKLALLLRQDEPEPQPVVPLRRRTWAGTYRPPMQAENRPVETASRARGRRVSSDAGQRFKELVNRWYAYWGMKRTVLSQINRIADDPEGSPGEALMLLDESRFQGPVLPDETDEEQRDRLAEWKEMLLPYRERLSGEIDTQELRSRHLLGIWEKWRKRGENDEWETLIAETIRARQDEIQEIEAEMADREHEIADLKVDLQVRGITEWT